MKQVERRQKHFIEKHTSLKTKSDVHHSHIHNTISQYIYENK